MQNIINLQYQLDKFYITLALSYIFAVDVFFYLGGFMVGFLFLKQYYRKRSWKMFPLTILQRYLRLAPLFAICMFIYWKVMPSLGSGPLYYQYMDPVAPCADTFWKDLLFVGNFS
jgi:peptidoglycan/LPS O-acetylase OafA/YrhL